MISLGEPPPTLLVAVYEEKVTREKLQRDVAFEKRKALVTTGKLVTSRKELTGRSNGLRISNNR